MAIEYGDGTNSSTGRVVQVVTSFSGSVYSFSASNSGWNDSGFSGQITPKDNNNKILVICHLGKVHNNGNSSQWLIRRDIGGTTTDIGVGTSTGNRPASTMSSYGTGGINSDHALSVHGTVLDNPTTTSAITYKIYCWPEDNGTGYINRQSNDANNAHPYRARTGSSLVMMEIAV